MNLEEKQKLLEIIGRCGLDNSEAKIYLSLLTLGKGTVHDIAKESGLNRTSSYSVIDRLKSKGFIGNVKGVNKKYFSAVRPQRFLQIQKDNWASLEKNIDELNYMYENAKKSQGVELYEGKEGLKTVLDMILDEAKEISIFGDGDSFKRSIPGWSENYSNKRNVLGIKSRIILRGTADAIKITKNMRLLTFLSIYALLKVEFSQNQFS